jgi:hypothetical protein
MSTSTLYNRLKASAEEFVLSMDVKPSTFSFDRARVLACRTSDFQQSYGHNLFISGKPNYQRGLDVDQLMSHLEEAVPRFEAVKGEVTDIYVDEPRKSVVVRSSIILKPKGMSETVENDIVWFLEMNESGEKVRKAKEFMDSVAPERLNELFQSAKK